MTYRYVTGYCNEEGSDGSSTVGTDLKPGNAPMAERSRKGSSERTIGESTETSEPGRRTGDSGGASMPMVDPAESGRGV